MQELRNFYIFYSEWYRSGNGKDEGKYRTLGDREKDGLQ